MDKRRGGCAPNIAYTLALLGERPRADGDGRAGFRRLPALARGGRRRHLARAARSPDKFTASFFCSTDVDEQPDRVVLHRRDGARRRAVVPHAPAPVDLVDHLAERSGGDDAVRRGVPDARHPVHLRSGPAVRAHVGRRARRRASTARRIVICNDYEFELIRQKTGLGEAGHPRRAPATLVVTRGEHGSSVMRAGDARRRAGRAAAHASSIRPASATPIAAAS